MLFKYFLFKSVTIFLISGLLKHRDKFIKQKGKPIVEEKLLHFRSIYGYFDFYHSILNKNVITV